MQGKLVCFDLETTGLSTAHDRIVELGAVKFIDGSKVSELHQYINPGMPMPKDASAVNGITDYMLADKPAFEEVAKQILDFFADCYICGHNSNKYDILMLMQEFQRAGMQWIPDKSRLIDTLALERIISKHTLTETYKRYFGHEYTDDFGTAHNAIPDTMATERVLSAQADKLDVHSLADLANACINKDSLDIAGNIVRLNGIPCFAFGKWKNHAVMAHQDYATWMLASDFPVDTKCVIRQILQGDIK